jgi:hypothetical protein
MNEGTGLGMPSGASFRAETAAAKGALERQPGNYVGGECIPKGVGVPESCQGLRAESASEMLSVAPGGALEGELIDQRLWGAIAALRERGLAKKAIARELGLDVKTVRKWWSRTWKPQERRARGRLLDRWAAFLRARAPEVGFNSLVLCRELAELGQRCCASSVAKYIAPWRAAPAQLLALERGQTIVAAALVPVGLGDPVADRLRRGLKLAGQLLGGDGSRPPRGIARRELVGRAHQLQALEKKTILRLLAYCFIGLERHSKLVLAWHLGRRDRWDTNDFMEKLSTATVGSFQLTTDGLNTYPMPSSTASARGWTTRSSSRSLGAKEERKRGGTPRPASSARRRSPSRATRRRTGSAPRMSSATTGRCAATYDG